MAPDNGNKHKPMGALDIFWKFTKDTLVTGGIYVLLILATLLLRYFAHQLENSPVHYKVVTFLEYGIFFGGSLVVILILAYVTVLTVYELVQSFKFALAEASNNSHQSTSSN